MGLVLIVVVSPLLSHAWFVLRDQHARGDPPSLATSPSPEVGSARVGPLSPHLLGAGLDSVEEIAADVHTASSPAAGRTVVRVHTEAPLGSAEIAAISRPEIPGAIATPLQNARGVATPPQRPDLAPTKEFLPAMVSDSLKQRIRRLGDNLTPRRVVPETTYSVVPRDSIPRPNADGVFTLSPRGKHAIP